MLAEVQSIDDAKNLMDTASAAKHYAQKHKLGKEAVGYAREIEIRAEIKLGEFLQLMERNKGAAANAIVRDNGVQPPTYTEIGISYISARSRSRRASSLLLTNKKGLECLRLT